MRPALSIVSVLLAIVSGGGVNAPVSAAPVAPSFIAVAAVNSTLTVMKTGSGSGTVASNAGAIDCGVVCSDSYTNGSSLTLTATPAAGSQFTGWLGPCSGTANCQFTINGATVAIATFAPTTLGPPRLDPDGTAGSDPYTDGLLILRYLFGLSEQPLVTNAVGPGGTRSGAAQIADYLTNVKPALDIDSDGRADPLTDGVLIVRYLFGLRGGALIGGAVAGGAGRTTAPAIEAQLALFFATTVVDPPLFSGSFTPPNRSDLATIPLPPMVGRPGIALITVPFGTLYFDPAERTPVSAAAECAAVVLSCYQPGERNWAGCLANVPQCADNTPWVGNSPMCCASACSARYQELRVAGEVGPAAFVKAIFRAPSCMPGLTGYVPAMGGQ